ncbi:hypothetical protein MRX96_045657 [Rhipicephalus microplus]
MLAGDWRALTITGPAPFTGGQDVVRLSTGSCSCPDLHIESIPEGSCLCLLYQNGWWPLRAELEGRRRERVSHVRGSLTQRRTEQTGVGCGLNSCHCFYLDVERRK